MNKSRNNSKISQTSNLSHYKKNLHDNYNTGLKMMKHIQKGLTYLHNFFIKLVNENMKMVLRGEKKCMNFTTIAVMKHKCCV